jgi:glycosyltransferase involved in cell wall biosynthesis
MTDTSLQLADVAVVILAYNEAVNLPQALASVCGWAREVFVVDSFSTDATVEIALKAGCTVKQNPFVDYAKQRNFAIEHLAIQSAWILFLDADEWLPAGLKDEIAQVILGNPEENGFYLKRRLIWMGKWIRRGYYPSWILRLFRRGAGKCEDRAVNEHLIVEGKIGYLHHDFIHEDHKDISQWIAKHNRYATCEALELLKQDCQQRQVEISVRFWGTQAERKRWLRYRVWNRMPPLIRPWVYFCYRYVLCGGFMEGRQGFIFHFLQALWVQILIDVKYLELRQRADRTSRNNEN